MSTRSSQFAASFLVLVLSGSGLAAAQSPEAPPSETPSEENIVGPLLERAEEAYRASEPEPERPADCVVSEDDTLIIVCAPVEDDPDRYRVASRLEDGDDSHLEWAGATPDVSGPGIFKGPATVSGLCFVPPCPKPPVYFFDVTALPEAPPGSDADRIARGLAPRGSRFDDGETGEEMQEAEPEPEPGDSPDPANPPER